MARTETRTILEELGTKPVLNARGIYTELGGSVLSPRVWAAMEEANRYFANLPDLLERSGRAIAQLVGAEAGRVTPGAAAAIALGTAACLTRGDPERIDRLPSTAGMPGRVVIQDRHRYRYDRCVRMVGAELVAVGGAAGTTPDELRAALRPDVAAVFFPAHLDGETGTLPLSDVCGLARAAEIPVLVDAAYLIDPPSRMATFTAAGADLVCFSAKYFGGPNAGGFLCGRCDLVDAVAALDFIRFEAGEEYRYGRPFKLDRQTVVAVYVALREWLETDHEARFANYRRKVGDLAERLEGIPGIEVAPMCFTMEETLTPEPVNCLHIRIPRGEKSAAHVDRALRDGTPAVVAHVVDDAIVLVVETIADEDDEVLAERLVAALAGASG